MVLYCFDHFLMHFRLLQSISIFNVFCFPIFTLLLFPDLFTTCCPWLIIYTYLPFKTLWLFLQGEWKMSVDEPTGSVSLCGKTSSGSWSSYSSQDTWNYSGGELQDQGAKTLTWPMLTWISGRRLQWALGAALKVTHGHTMCHSHCVWPHSQSLVLVKSSWPWPLKLSPDLWLFGHGFRFKILFYFTILLFVIA